MLNNETESVREQPDVVVDDDVDPLCVDIPLLVEDCEGFVPSQNTSRLGDPLVLVIAPCVAVANTRCVMAEALLVGCCCQSSAATPAT